MKTSRRDFLKASTALAGFSILPAGAWANSPNSRLCVASIGVGLMGKVDIGRISSHSNVQMVGFADVDSGALNHPDITKHNAAHFKDYQEMLSALGDKIDAVSVSTPDHAHFPATRMAMEMGKHVYCQKPLTHTIPEARFLRELSMRGNLTTQMGIQCHSMEAYRLAVALIQQGIIGKVSRVYIWSNKAWGYDGPPYEGADPVPESLDWNLWLRGRPERPFLNGKYHPGQWRRIIDFGNGTMGDMGVHILDTPHTALNLGAPRLVRSSCREPNGFSHPTRATINYRFPGTEYTTDTVDLTWYEGADAPSVTPQDNPDLELPEGKKLPDQGVMFIGEDGARMLLPHYGGPQFLPRDLLQNIVRPKLKAADHYLQWVDACLGKDKCSAPFEYSSILTTTNLMGVIANQLPEQILSWDADNWQFKNSDPANLILNKYNDRDKL